MADLTAEQRAAVARRVAAKRAAERAASIEPRPEGTPVPLSSRQRSLWLVDALDPSSTAYNHVIALRIDGPLDATVLADAFGDVVSRHEALRSIVRIDDDGRPWSEIVAADAARLDIELGQGTVEDAEQILRRAALRRFDLTTDLPVRLIVVRHTPTAWTVGILGHHIALDNRSAVVVVEELFDRYARRRSDPDAELPMPPLQYGDLVVWEEQRVDAVACEQLQAWWRQHLRGVSPVLDLPTDRPRPRVSTHDGARAPLELSIPTTTAVRGAARAAGVTEYVWCLASFAALLSRWSGQRSFAIGTPFAGRDRAELADVVGFVNNTLVIPVRLGVTTTWQELLGQVRNDVVAAFEHAALGVQQVVEAVGPPRDLTRNPLFQVNFRIAAPPADEFFCEDLAVRRMSVDLGYSKFDLSFELHSRPTHIGGHVEYDTELFGTETIRSSIDAWSAIVVSVLDDPNVPVVALPRPTSRRAERPGHRRVVRRPS